jgi:hypothetical protein
VQQKIISPNRSTRFQSSELARDSSKTSLNSDARRRVKTQDSFKMHVELIQASKINRKRDFYKKIMDQNLNISKRINQM